jgi:hypothetical protein
MMGLPPLRQGIIGRKSALERQKGAGVPKQHPAGDDGVGRMQFLLELRRRGIADVAVLRALDEVPREHFVDGRFTPPTRTRRCRSPAARPSASLTWSPI